MMKKLFLILSIVLSVGFINFYDFEKEPIEGKFKLFYASRIVKFTNIYTAYNQKAKTSSKTLQYSIQKKTNPAVYEINIADLDSIIMERNDEEIVCRGSLYLKEGKVILAHRIYNTFYFETEKHTALKCSGIYVEKIKFNNDF